MSALRTVRSSTPYSRSGYFNQQAGDSPTFFEASFKSSDALLYGIAGCLHGSELKLLLLLLLFQGLADRNEVPTLDS